MKSPRGNESKQTSDAQARIRAAKANELRREREQRDQVLIHKRVMSRLRNEGISSRHARFKTTYRTYSFQEVNALAARRKQRSEEQAKRVAVAEEVKVRAAARKRRLAATKAARAASAMKPKSAKVTAPGRGASPQKKSTAAVAPARPWAPSAAEIRRGEERKRQRERDREIERQLHDAARSGR